MSTPDELFPVPVSLSPKRAWLKRHSLRTDFDPRFDSQPLQESPETGAEIYPWICSHWSGNTELPGVGMTEDEAIIDWCRKNDVQHWTQEGDAL